MSNDAYAKCARCGEKIGTHELRVVGKRNRRRCADGGWFRYPKVHSRVANSFTDAEVDIMHQVARMLQRGGDPRLLVRHPAFASVARKAGRMAERVRKQKADRAARELKRGVA